LVVKPSGLYRGPARRRNEAALDARYNACPTNVKDLHEAPRTDLGTPC
jgi:hypothetical protein